MEKIKLFLVSERGKQLLIAGIIILVGTGSFQLGRLSKYSSSGIKIEYPAALGMNGGATQEASAVLATNPGYTSKISPSPKSSVTPAASKNFFASSKGSKYYPSSCSAGKTIKMENRVYFETRKTAEAAGYELSSSCK